MTGEEWLHALFEFEYCAECGGDWHHHTAVSFTGSWFARCEYEAPEGQEYHPVIVAFRHAMDKGGCLPCVDSAGVFSKATHMAPYADGSPDAPVCDDHLSTWYRDTEGLPAATPIGANAAG